MKNAAYRANVRKLVILAVLMVLAVVLYMVIDVNFANPKFLKFSMKIRTPKLLAMLVAAFAIGAASIVFQSIINNTIVTPCLLGMNSLYTLLHTAVYFFFGASSFLAVNANAAFMVDLLLMIVVATFIYGYLFKKTNYNVLYVLLIGTVLSSFFGSVQSTMIRVMEQSPDSGGILDWYDDFSGRSVSCRACICLCNTGQRVHNIGRRHLFPVFVDEKEVKQ